MSKEPIAAPGGRLSRALAKVTAAVDRTKSGKAHSAENAETARLRAALYELLHQSWPPVGSDPVQADLLRRHNEAVAEARLVLGDWSPAPPTSHPLLRALEEMTAYADWAMTTVHILAPDESRVEAIRQSADMRVGRDTGGFDAAFKRARLEIIMRGGRA